ncbi:MAG: DUF1573 domain-containing protein [Paludibacteraceae bacterium]|nr:DUF1573 domain-containing protein [Paludibacteraceae bacterium]
MKIKRHTYLLLVLTLLCPVGCRKVIGPTQIRVEDPVRHYLPIIQGDELHMLWKIYNDGPKPLIIDEIQPSCSAITLTTEEPSLIPVGDSAIMIFNFDTGSNVNLAAHKIRIYGNIVPDGEVELAFDVQIVRPSIDHSDYEERFSNKMTEEDIANGETKKNLYYTDEQSPDALL